MNKLHTLLLILIRSALGNKEASVDDFLPTANAVEWREVMELANRQGVQGLCFEGL